MKRKNFKSRLAALVVFLLVGVLCVTTAATSLGGNSILTNSSTNSTLQAKDGKSDVSASLDPNKIIKLGSDLKNTDKVGYIIELEEAPLIDTYLASPSGYGSFVEYLRSEEGKNAAENLTKKQNAMYNKIARKLDAKLLYNYGNVMNGFAIEINYGDSGRVEDIARKAGADSAYISEVYGEPQIEAVENDVVAQDTGIFESIDSIDEGYGGRGQLVAVLDTGLDWEHIAFSPYNHLFRGGTDKDKNSTIEGLKLTEEDVKKLAKDENTSYILAANYMTPGIEASSLYINEKIPFAYDYGDSDAQVSTHLGNMHGTHVSGIVAGHSDTPYYASTNANGTDAKKIYLNEVTYKKENGHTVRDENGDPVIETSKYYDSEKFKTEGVYEYANDDVINDETRIAIIDETTEKQITGIQGVAPQAQIAAMKVFSDYSGGTQDYMMLAALNDCLLLDVDVINMSLGSDRGFRDERETEIEYDEGKGADMAGFYYNENGESKAYSSIQDAFDRVGKAGISLVIAAGNSYSSSYMSHAGLNLTSNPDSGTLTYPSTVDAAFSIASIEGVKSKYLTATNNSGTEEYGVAYYGESANMSGNAYDFMNDVYDRIQRIKYAHLSDSEREQVPVEQQYSDSEISAADREIASNPSRYNKVMGYVTKPASVNNYAQGHSEDYIIKIPYITINGIGISSDYAAKDVVDKIVFVSRGETTFEEKITEANNQKAFAFMIYNNASGVIRMQIESSNPIPSCSITMDAAAAIKNRDNNGTNGMIVLDPSKEAGPFISEFSCWGPLPDLGLKPDITAHGGEIYSAACGDETAYARISGTSMACPNMAGVVTLLRQYLSKTDNAKKFGLIINNSASVTSDSDPNNEKVDTVDEKEAMERRIYQLLMSTATIAMNEENNPYSPRKQGAGLGDLEKSRHTEQYLYTMEGGKEGDRTKLELLDDPERKGVYDAEFYLKNVSTSAQTYELGEYVMTEGISIDGKTVNEKAHVFDKSTYKTFYRAENINTSSSISTSNGRLTVPASTIVKISVTVNLGNEAKEWLEQFANGMYVEGYFLLKNVTEGRDKLSSPDLNIPYLAFYGDWADAPMMDYDVYETTADVNDDNIEDDDKRYPNGQYMQLYGKYSQNGEDLILPLGQFVFKSPDEFEDLDALEDKCAIGYNDYNAVCGVYAVSGFLRNAKRVYYRITDVETGETLWEDVTYNAKKGLALNTGIGGAALDIPIGDLNVTNNHKYNVAVYPVLDWDDCAALKSIDAVIDYNEAYNRSHMDNPRRYMWDTDFWVDTDAPFISGSEIRIVKDSNGNPTAYSLDLSVTDNHYVQALSFDYYNPATAAYETIYSEDGTLRPINSQRNSTTLISTDISVLWDRIDKALRFRLDPANKDNTEAMEEAEKICTFQVFFYDYAMNGAYYEIDVMDLLPRVERIVFADIGNYTDYTNSSNSSDTISVLTSTNKTYEKDENGIPTGVRMDSITIVPKQKVELSKALYSVPDAWPEDLEWTTSNDKTVKVDPETGEIYGGEVGGTATVTVKSRTTGATASISVRVLDQANITKYSINVDRLQAEQMISGLSFTETNGRYFNAGETHTVEIETNPWYYDVKFGDADGEYFLRWTSNAPYIAKVEPVKDESGKVDPFKQNIIANNSYYDEKSLKEDSSYSEKGEYKKNSDQSATITVTLCQYSDTGRLTIGEGANARKYNETYYTANYIVSVLPEFVVEGGTLTEYHGTPIVDEEDGLKWVKIPNNLDITTIGSNVFYMNNDIEAIEFNHGITTIDRAACAYMTNLQKVVFPDTLESIGEFAFVGYMTSNMDYADTKLSIIDTTRCTKPIQIGSKAFALQRYIGVDIKATMAANNGELPVGNGEDTADDTNGGKATIKLLDGNTRKLFDMSKIRIVGDYGFYGAYFLSYADLTGLRSCDQAAFYGLGSSLPKYFGSWKYKKTEIKEEDGRYEVTDESRYTSPAYANGDGSGSDGNKEVDSSGNPIHATVKLGDNVTLGAASFAGTGIGSMTLGMNRFGEQAFYGAIDVVTGDKDLNNDGSKDDVYNAQYLGELQNITFTGKDIVFEDNVFFYSSVQNITFASGSSVKKIGDVVFAYSQLKTVTFASGATCEEIGNQAFFNCTSLTEFTLPAGLTKLGDGVFGDCTSLKTVKIDPKCALTAEGFGEEIEGTNVMSSIFDGCNKFEKFEIADESGVSPASNDNTYKKSLHLSVKDGVLYGEVGNNNQPDTLVCVPQKKTLSNNSFTDAPENKAEGAQNSTPNSDPTPMSEPEGSSKSTLPTGITKLAMFAFANNTHITELDCSSVTEIGDGAFYGCTNLKKITFSSNLKEIPSEAFYNCKALATINGSNGSPSAQDGAATNGESLTNLESIGIFAFYGCEALENFTIANAGDSSLCKLTSIGTGAFYGCKALKSFTLPQTIIMVEAFTFYRCESLETVTFTNKILVVDSYAFTYSGIKEVDITNCQQIGHYTFEYCKNLKTVNLPGAIYIGTYAFAANEDNINQNGSALYAGSSTSDSEGQSTSQQDFASRVTSVEGAERIRMTLVNGEPQSQGDGGGDDGADPTYLESVTLGTGACNIADYAFYNQKNLAKINLEYCTSIGDNAFAGCLNLRKVNLTNCSTIGNKAFFNSGLYMIGFGVNTSYTEVQYMGTISGAVTSVGSAAFACTDLIGFNTNTENFFTDEDNVLYKRLASGGYELVSYPSKHRGYTTETIDGSLIVNPSKVPDIDYTVLEGTVRIAPYAFYGTQDLYRVNLPTTLTSIGDAAFLNSSVRIYNFTSYEAPNLEATYATVEAENGDQFFWQVYANFYKPFNYSNGLYVETVGEEEQEVYKYNSIRPHNNSDSLDAFNISSGSGSDGAVYNTSYLGGGFHEGTTYGIVISRPSNGVGYGTFVISNYFDSEMLAPEALEPTTREVMTLITNLPEPAAVIESDRDSIVSARGRFDNLRSDQQKAFVRTAGLVDKLEDCEDAIAAIDLAVSQAVENVLSLIRALPEPSTVTLDHEAQVVEARQAFNALPTRGQTTVSSDTLAMKRLEECERRIAELKASQDKGCGCGSCGTITFGAGGGGIGLLIGLGIIAIACLAIVFARRKKSDSKSSK